ncbi:hypothetical protein RSSM_03739 [Rhodopirellula sallentina SM41]|uniref:Uncharacterized protein n=1 Tax=Rhodopirellula sallentina SM41 TaxID=1263870 RepID=M5U040_9BACT|nr:hypothetical protein RSSM_03739 [Rhodopirellula sallentina SM41]
MHECESIEPPKYKVSCFLGQSELVIGACLVANRMSRMPDGFTSFSRPEVDNA